MYDLLNLESVDTHETEVYSNKRYIAVLNTTTHLNVLMADCVKKGGLGQLSYINVPSVYKKIWIYGRPENDTEENLNKLVDEIINSAGTIPNAYYHNLKGYVSHSANAGNVGSNFGSSYQIKSEHGPYDMEELVYALTALYNSPGTSNYSDLLKKYVANSYEFNNAFTKKAMHKSNVIDIADLKSRRKYKYTAYIYTALKTTSNKPYDVCLADDTYKPFIDFAISKYDRNYNFIDHLAHVGKYINNDTKAYDTIANSTLKNFNDFESFNKVIVNALKYIPNNMYDILTYREAYSQIKDTFNKTKSRKRK